MNIEVFMDFSTLHKLIFFISIDKFFRLSCAELKTNLTPVEFNFFYIVFKCHNMRFIVRKLPNTEFHFFHTTLMFQVLC